LKQSTTGRFLRDAGRWTADAAEAFDFKTTPAAMDFSRIHDCQETSIILKFANARYDLELKNCC